MGSRNLINTPDMGAAPLQMGFLDDFDWYVTAHRWTTTVDSGGTIAVGDAANGIATLTPSSGNADNDEAYLKTTNELFKVASNRVIEGEALIQFTEAATNAANVAFGFQNAVGADSIIDNGAGLKVSGDTIAIYKVDGGTVWKCVTVINGGTAVVSTSTQTAGGTAYQRLNIVIKPVEAGTSTNIEVTFHVDGKQLVDSTTRRPIQHTFALASATEMQAFVGVKNGTAAAQTLLVDYIGAWQTR